MAMTIDHDAEGRIRKGNNILLAALTLGTLVFHPWDRGQDGCIITLINTSSNNLLLSEYIVCITFNMY